MADTFATRRFTYRDENRIDREIAKGEDLSKRKPEIPEQQLEDWRGAGLVGEKPAEEKPVAPTKA